MIQQEHKEGSIAMLSETTLIVPDLHDHPTRIEIVRRTLKAARRKHGEVRLAMLGDAIDRGISPKATLRLIADEKAKGLIQLAGNHEAMACLGCLRQGPEASSLRRIWMGHGGAGWVQAMGGAHEAVAMLRSMQDDLWLAAEISTERGKVLLTHAQLPSKEGWKIIERAGRLPQLSAEEGYIKNPHASWLWGDPRAGEFAQARGHALAIHGHNALEKPALGMVKTDSQDQQRTLMLDLIGPHRLATVLILPDGRAQLEWGSLSKREKKEIELQ